MELLILLVQRRGELVTREEIVQQLWGDAVFLDTDHSINTAIRKVRMALRDDPEKPRFIETVVGKGYRFAAAVTLNGDSPQVQPSPTPVETLSPAPEPYNRQQRRQYTWQIALAGIFFVALLATGFLVLSPRGARPSTTTQIKSIAVLPLDNLSGDPRQDYLADGMTEALIGRLAGIRNLRVISRTSVLQFKGSKVSVPEIARMLGGVDAIVEGSVIRDGDHVRVHAQLIRAATDAHIWAETYDRQMQDALALQSDLARAIADKVAVTITGEERARLVATRNVSPEVYESYLKGRFEKDDSKEDVEKKIAYFQDAIDKDPTFASAYVGLAESYDRLATVFVGAPPDIARDKLVSAAKKALQLDPTIAEAHALLADVYQQRWQWVDAETEYKRAIELNPNDAEAYMGYAGWLICQGRFDEAFVWAQHARELNPLGDYGTEIGWMYFQARRYDDAVRELRSSLGVNPNDAAALWYLGFVLIASNKSDQAIAPLEKATSISHRSPAVSAILVRAYAHADRRADALRLMAMLNSRLQSGYVPTGAFVNAYLGLGDTEQTFRWLERAYEEHSNILQYMKVHPYFDPIRGDARFKDLLHRVGLDGTGPPS